MNKTLTGNWSCQIVFQTKNIKCKTTLSIDVNFEMFWYGMKLVWFCCDLASPKVNCHRLKDGWWQEIERSWKKLKGRSRLFIKYLAQQTSTVGKFFNFSQYKLFWNVVDGTLDSCKETKMLATSRMKTAPSKPLGSSLTHTTNYAQNNYLVLQGPVYHRFGIF